MTQTYTERMDANRRLTILQILAQAASYTLPEPALRGALDGWGHVVSRDRLRADLAWLEEQSLVICQTPGGIYLPTLTAQGQDVADGRTQVPGVERPRAR